MELLVSVTCAEDALAAVAGGADIIDAKDPSKGALGTVTPDDFAAIRAAVPHERVVSAALGDAGSGDMARSAAELVALGAGFVKVGFANVVDPVRAGALLAEIVRAVSRETARSGVVAVAYADASRARSIDARTVVRVAADAGACGVLVDTADKSGAGLMELWSPAELCDWVAAVRELGMMASVAGRLGLDDIALVSSAGADVVGVRGAACVGGRSGRVSVELVRRLRDAITPSRLETPTAAQPTTRWKAEARS
ncbi:MAG TPA: (5-formylfuran-3-yl)methyl phosphate synthase [Gemmatimonadaceae bacterium]|nr:(5-formylfuran-3-yl)methyl phosphate synthase [Gemmatimonadaceae bacterium]